MKDIISSQQFHHKKNEKKLLYRRIDELESFVNISTNMSTHQPTHPRQPTHTLTSQRTRQSKRTKGIESENSS